MVDEIQAGSAERQRPPARQLEAERRDRALRGERPAREPGRLPAGPLLAALKDAAIAAAIAAALFFFFIGIRTSIQPGGLALGTRWVEFGFAVAAVFVGRLLLQVHFWMPPTDTVILIRRVSAVALFALGVSLYWLSDDRRAWVFLLIPALVIPLALFGKFSRPGAPSRERVRQALPRAMTLERAGIEAERYAMPALAVIAILFPILMMVLFPQRERQFIDLGILVLTYIMLGWGLNIVVGLAGLLDLGYVAFYAVGAYSFAIIAREFDLGFWQALPIAGALAALWGIILGFPVLRLRGDYLAIVTLAFGEIIRVVLLNWYEFTGGPNGISRIPDPTLFGYEFKRGDDGVAALLGIPFASVHKFVFLYYIILVLALITNFVTMRLRRLPVGRAWEALREDEIACRSLGINTRNTKLTAFSIGAMFGGFAGSFFATRQGFISPESFTFIESALILAIVVLGGLGSQLGVVIASVVMIGGFEFFRELQDYRMLIFGMLMVLIMVWRPRGLIATREPSAVLRERKLIGSDMVSQGRGG